MCSVSAIALRSDPTRSEKISFGSVQRVRPSVLMPGLTVPFGPPGHPAFPSGHSFVAHLLAHQGARHRRLDADEAALGVRLVGADDAIRDDLAVFVLEADGQAHLTGRDTGALLLGRRSYEAFAPVWPTMDEFAGYNAKRILNCLSSGPGMGADLNIHSGSFSTTFGSPDRGALIDLDVSPDKEPGEMVLRLQVDGY